MFATNTNPLRPEPNLVGVPEGKELEDFKSAVSRRLLEADGRPELNFSNEFNLLTLMNNEAVDFLLFRELGHRGLAWHDRTTQAFFAAYWAMRFGSPEDRQLLRDWVVDRNGESLDVFNEFWTFAAEMPNALVDRKRPNGLVDRERWLAVFRPCYAPPESWWPRRVLAWILGRRQASHNRVQWQRRMIYHSFARMQERSQETIDRWRGSFRALTRGTARQRRLHQEIEGGFKPINRGICPYGADPLEEQEGIAREVSKFRLHQYQVTNEMYEEFDPLHRQDRWYGGRHPLGRLLGQGDDRCPVVNVTWYDAWCFAAWCGHRLPTELEWEHACRARSAGAWCFGNDEAELAKYG
jgi:hypothetical protein